MITPPSPFLDDDKVFPQLGPLYVKKFVEENSEHEVDVFHGVPSDFDGYDVVGFSCTTPQFQGALDMVQEDKILVIGGSHPSHYPVEKPFDHSIVGDGNDIFLNLLNDGITKKTFCNTWSGCLDDKNSRPHRDESLLDYVYYLDGHRTTTIMTARGCPNNCAFCEDAGSTLRLKDPEVVGSEMDECKELGFDAIMFFDDLFCLNNRRVKVLCDVIKPRKMPFRCFAHASNFNKEMARMLADAGCVEIGYGAESMTQSILDSVNKNTTVKQNWDIIEIAHEAGIKVKAFLMIGLPGESDLSCNNLLEFVEESGVDDFDLSIFYPYKGTTIRRQLKRFDLNVNEGDSIGFYKGVGGNAECVVSTSELSSSDIVKWKNDIYSLNKRFCK